MSVAYCYNCLHSIWEGDCEECGCKEHDFDNVVYGESRTAYLRGYRDAKAGKEENI